MTILENQLVLTGFLGMVIKVLHPALEQFDIGYPLRNKRPHLLIVASCEQLGRNVEDLTEASIDRDDARH